MDPKKLSIKDYSYYLPEERVAKYPLEQRDASKLLIYKNGNINEDIYLNLDAYLLRDSLLVFNNTKVVEARLRFKKSTGSTIELFCLEPSDDYHDITSAMLQKGKVLWKCLVGGAKKWKTEVLENQIGYGNSSFILKAEKKQKLHDYFLIEFSWSDARLSFAEVLHAAGEIPLPPYLNRSAEEADKERYQTIYAKHDGSVAAPTAGLHFTRAIFERLAAKDIQHDFVTLHVGAGTFKPVKSETMQEHEMHAEFIDVRKELIENLISKPHTIIAVGTTSLRTLESLYWMGVKLQLLLKQDEATNISPEELSVKQWEPYENASGISTEEALQTLFLWMQQNNMQRLITSTQIIISPGYTLKIAKALITNFHQPQSTLLLLIAAIVKDDWKKIYQYALEHQFRFLSYGDGSLIFA
ncbi:MAG: S-adenosylmethionine:tRNA ribosyltransferase-isomerase [Ilyomonas sp.]